MWGLDGRIFFAKNLAKVKANHFPMQKSYNTGFQKTV